MGHALDQNDLKTLADHVVTAFVSVNELTSALPSSLAVWASTDLPINLERRVFVTKLLERANNYEQMEELLRRLYVNTGHFGLVEFIHRTAWFISGLQQQIDTATQALLLTDLPFINRETFRGLLKRFLDPAGKPQRVLIIPASASAGKSYSQYLMRHVAEALDFCFIFVDCLRSRTGLDAARLIANELGIFDSTLDAQIQNQSRPGLTFKSWLKGKLDRAVTRRSWIVFDHVNKPKSTDEVESIALALAEASALGEFKTLLVTLIESDYVPRPASPFGGTSPVYRDHPVSPLSATDMALFEQRWAAGRGHSLTIEEAMADAAAVFSSLNQPLDCVGTSSMVALLAQKMAARNLI